MCFPLLRSLAAIACSVPLLLHAQVTNWGMTSLGGAANIGTIYTLTEGGTHTKRHDMTRVQGAGSRCNLVRAGNGRYYGVTEYGGTTGDGTLFSYDPASGTFTTLVNFTGTNGSRPFRGLVQHSNGRLYGVCSEGGTNNFGTLFEYNIGTSTFTLRYSFTATTGRNPRGAMVEASNGRLYGVAYAGGAGAGVGNGTLYEYNPSTNSFAKVQDMSTAALLRPYAGLMRATNNILYGVSQFGGGVDNGGSIYSYNVSTNTLTKLRDFATVDGLSPIAELMQASNGVLYGVCPTGGVNGNGTLFSWAIATNTFTKLAEFGGSSGVQPQGRLVQANNGLLYGVSAAGGTSNQGVLYSFTIASSTLAGVTNMSTIGFTDAFGGMIQDPAGTLVGTCNSGGSASEGGIFRFTISTSDLTPLVAFLSSVAAFPKGRLTQVGTGLMYGMTNLGGTTNQGVIFSFDPAGLTFTSLKDLGGSLGGFPSGSLCLANGRLYGLCSSGGANNGGTLIEYDPATNTVTKMLDLDVTTGTAPQEGLFSAANGKLYGTTTAGGTSGRGTLFEYVPATNTYTVLFNFTNNSGSQPNGDLMQAANGLLYGTLRDEGLFNKGTLYSFNTSTNTFSKLYDFNGIEGGAPAGQMVQAPNGKLYGMCSEDGLFFNGCIFSWDIATATYTQEYDMITNNGGASTANLLLGTDGRLYGACSAAGSSGNGTLFRFTPSNATYQVLHTFTGTSGAQPFDGMIREATPAADVALNLKVFLGGPYNTGTGLMNDALRSLPSFPLTEPYTAAGFTQVGGGGETINPSVLTTSGNNAIVDWMIVQLRNKNDNTQILRTKCVLLQRDGDVVDLDGVSPVTMNVPSDQYFVAVRHRNHLGVMTNTAVALSSTPVSLNYTDGSVTTFGTNAQRLAGAVRLLWEGNVVPDNSVRYAGSGNDRDPILVRIGGTVPTNTLNGYWPEDVTLDGQVRYAGSGNDRDPILINIGGTVPTASRVQQLP